MKNVFENAGDVLGGGVDELNKLEFSHIALEDIIVKVQIRTLFEDDDNSIVELSESIKKRGVLMPILLRNAGDTFELVAGERRYRAAKLAGLETIPAYIRDMTEAEAADAQLAENIQRQNLTQLEIAKKLQDDLNILGSVEAVLEKHQKGRSWLSKMIGLLTLPEQTKRLLTENVTADNEVIGAVKAVEAVDPEKAKELVDDLKKTRGDGNAREKAKAVKDEVKPSPKKAAAKTKTEQKPETKTDIKTKTEAAKPANIPEQTDIVADSDAAQKLHSFYFAIYEHGAKPNVVLETMSADDKAAVRDYLYNFYAAGKQAKDAGRAAMLGLRSGEFATDGVNAFNLVSFLYGLNGVDFDLLNIFGSVKE
jgi:ParB family chromosome partitioning protein